MYKTDMGRRLFFRLYILSIPSLQLKLVSAPAAKNHSAPHENNIKVFALRACDRLFNGIHSFILFFLANGEMSHYNHTGVQDG